jgi:hypothetical protein
VFSSGTTTRRVSVSLLLLAVVVAVAGVWLSGAWAAIGITLGALVALVAWALELGRFWTAVQHPGVQEPVGERVGSVRE